MFLDRVLGQFFAADPNGRRARLCTLVVVVVLVPVALGSSPDPIWVAGVYDNADSDDAVLAAMSVDGVLDAAQVALFVAPRPSVALSAHLQTDYLRFCQSSEAGRAPPRS